MDFSPETIKLFEAAFFRQIPSKKAYRFYYTDGFAVAELVKSPDNIISVCSHKHDEYEFIIPVTPVPYLTNENAVYLGEVGAAYPVQSGRQHGIKYNLSDVSHNDIVINRGYFEKVLADMGLSGFVFNAMIYTSKELLFYIKTFKKEFEKQNNIKLKLLAQLICNEIIDLATQEKSDQRKNKSDYQKGMHSAADYINNHYTEQISANELALMCGLSTNYFSTCFKKAFGYSPTAYITKLRISKAKMLLEETNFSIKEIAISSGFMYINSFTGAFKSATGLSPKEYRKSFSHL